MTSKNIDISDLFIDPHSPTESVPEHSCSYLGNDGIVSDKRESTASGSRCNVASTDWNLPSCHEKIEAATSTFIHDNQSSLSSNDHTHSLSNISKQPSHHDTNSHSSSVHVSIDDLFG